MQGARFLLVAAAALVLRLAYVLWLPVDRADRVTPDSGHYLDAMHAGLWGLPERMPLYPAYLWIVDWLTGSGSEVWPVVGQCLLDTLTCLFVAAIAARFDPRAGLPAGLAAACNPVQIVYAGFILTDTLFLFFATFALWRLVVWMDTQRPADAACAGLLMALALMVRVHVWPFALLLPVFCLVSGFRRADTARTAFSAALLAIAVVLPLAGTAVFNRVQFGHLALTTQGGEHTLYWIVPLVRETQFGVSYTEERERLYEIYSRRYPVGSHSDPFQRAEAQMGLAHEAMADVHLTAVARSWGGGMIVNLFAPALTQVPAVSRLPRASWYATPGDDPLSRLRNYLLAIEGGAFVRFLAAGLAIEIVLRVLALGGLVCLLGRSRMPLALPLLAGWAVFTLLIAGPVVAPKYRLPAEPVFCVFVGVAIARALRYSSERASPATSG